jgi:hypothetical protein
MLIDQECRVWVKILDEMLQLLVQNVFGPVSFMYGTFPAELEAGVWVQEN